MKKSSFVQPEAKVSHHRRTGAKEERDMKGKMDEGLTEVTQHTHN